MPKTLFRTPTGLTWKKTTIRLVSSSELETELLFDLNGREFAVGFDTIPDKAFLVEVIQTRSLGIYEWPLAERGWLESGRYRIAVNDDDDGMGSEEAVADKVRWGFVEPSS